jgi:hypothetical protein
MRFDVAEGSAVLERTPAALSALLAGLPEGWTRGDEGPDTWSPHDVVSHLIEGERVVWVPRARVILAGGEHPAFVPFDRGALLEWGRGRPLAELLDTFARLRAENLATLRGWSLTPERLALTGIHPEFGRVTLAQLLANWVAHDLGQLVQVARTMARQYADAAGPWVEYLSVLRR